MDLWRWLSVASDAASLFGVIAALTVLPIYRVLRTMRQNHLEHIEAAVARIEAKLEDHIKWHLDH